MEESEVCSLPGGFASLRKQFETQETTHSHSSAQFHFQQRTVQVRMRPTPTKSSRRTRCLWDLQVYLCFPNICGRFCIAASSVFHSEWPDYVCDGFKGPKQSNRLPLFNLAVLQCECTAWQIHCNLVSICDYSFPTTMSNLAWQILCMLFSCVLLSFGWWGKFAVRHVHICCFNRGPLEEDVIPGCERLCGVRTYFTLLIFTGSVELGGDSVEQQQQQQAGGPQQSSVAFQPRNNGKKEIDI